MSCVRPLAAYRGPGGSIVFDKVKSLTRVSFPLPCGQCIGCRLMRAKQWGMRCLHEAKLWPSNTYVTLTYADEHLPPFGSLCIRDVQLFMKRLRKGKEPAKVRFFLGGEYGTVNKRPHYHALLFNCGFRDLKLLSKNQTGQLLYTSDELLSYWQLGHCSVGEVSYESALYCAKYAMKKVTGDDAVCHYEVFDEWGELHVRRPEFALMSRRPGIGSGYYERFGNEVVHHDNVIINGKPVKPPRFYDGRTQKALVGVHDEDAFLCLCALCKNKRARKRAGVLAKDDNTPERLAVKETLMLRGEQQKERPL